ncbi:hybrid sensor histidine kinase/response regulator [Vibrio taketomensis]|uniref:hybrid sensor histidine kinase/response regulator n=1 Tax=Vibrio taketomensis TaxID=2572923 RepID=UPI00138A61DA|nr:hybrid sensor histidine kinase/response regulator [Vibrio taketomensis]
MTARSSLKRKSIVALALYLALVVATIGAVSYFAVEPPIRAQLMRNLDSRSQIIASEIETSFQSSLGVLSSLVGIARTGQSSELQAQIVQNIFHSFDGVTVSGGLWPNPNLTNGQVSYDSLFVNRTSEGEVERIYSWNNATLGGYDGEQWYSDAQIEPLGSVVWSPVYIDPFTHVQMITASSPYYVNGEFAGVATVDLSLTRLLDAIKAHAEQYGLGIIIRDANHQVVLNHNVQLVEGIYISHQTFGDFGWTLDVVNANQRVADQTYDLVSKVEMGIMPVMLVCVLIGYVVINRTLIDPIVRIARDVDDSKQGGVIDIDYRQDDEIKHLIDVFNEKTRYLEREKQNAQASTQAKSAFLATISHEVRTPMNGVLGTAQILLKTDLTSEQRKHLKTLYDSGDHMMMLLNEILDYSKIEQGRLELEKAPFPLSSIMGSINSVYHTLCAEKGLEFRIVNNIDKLRWYNGDKARLRQVLFNLLNNAVKFTASGFVEISFDEVSLDGRNCLNIKVTDSGVGIAHSSLDKIFKPFVQAESSTTRKFGGTGLGLSIVKQISELMQGDISVQSELNRGTTFDVLLALDTCLPAQADIVEHHKLDYSGLKVLIVEDNRTNSIIINTLLSAKGFECQVVGDGQQAIDTLQSHQFDLIMMDNHMPIKDGISATNEIRAMHSKQAKTLIFGCTADLFKETQDRMRAAGVDAIVSKPIDEKELDDMLFRFADKLYQFKSPHQRAVKFNTEQELIALYIALENRNSSEVNDMLQRFYTQFETTEHDQLLTLLKQMIEHRSLPSQYEIDLLTMLLKDV